MMRARLAVVLSLLAAPALAQLQAVDATKRPTCTDGQPWAMWLLNESSATDCDKTAGGAFEALCCCKEGSVAACASAGGGGNSFETIDLPSGTDPVADSATDTLAVTCSAPLTCTGNSGTDTWALAWSSTPLISTDIDTSAELRGILTDETGTGAAVFVGCANCLGGTEINESGLAAVPTATALAANPGDCSTGDGTEFAWRINTTADLSCAAVAFTSKTLDRKTSATTINNTVTETAIYSYTIPANTVDANGELRLHLDNEWLNNTGASRGFVIKAKLGGTTVIEFTTGNSWAGTSSTRSLVEVDLRLSALGSTSSQIVTLRWQMQSSVGAFGTLTTGVGRTGTTSPPFLLVNSGALSQDMTASKTLEVSITLSTNSTSLEWKTYSGTLELLNP